MKNLMLLGLMTTALAAGPAMQAQAINREWSAVAGFVGGWVLASNYHYYDGYGGCGGYRGYGGYGERRCYTYAQPTVIVQQPCPQQVIVVQQPVAGHYELQNQQIWVQGSWVMQQVDYNTYQKIWTPGYYKTETVRVWVPGDVVCSSGGP